MEKQRYPRVLGALSRADLSLKLQGSYFLIPNVLSLDGTSESTWIDEWFTNHLCILAQFCFSLNISSLGTCSIFFSVENMAKFRIWIPTFQLALSQDIFFHIIDNHVTHFPPLHFLGVDGLHHYTHHDSPTNGDPFSLEKQGAVGGSRR